MELKGNEEKKPPAKVFRKFVIFPLSTFIWNHIFFCEESFDLSYAILNQQTELNLIVIQTRWELKLKLTKLEQLSHRHLQQISHTRRRCSSHDRETLPPMKTIYREPEFQLLDNRCLVWHQKAVSMSIFRLIRDHSSAVERESKN